MITEDYCSYNIAKLLKEKGFKNEYCHNMLLAEDGSVIYKFTTFRNKDDAFEATMQFKKQIPYVTHQMAIQFLREEYSFHIYTFYNNEWVYEIQSLNDSFTYSKHEGNTSEEAVEAALKYVLENIITKEEQK